MADSAGFLAAVKRLPNLDRIALQGDDGTCTYRELIDAAVRWERALSSAVFGGEVVVVDYDESALVHTSVLLGVMAAGGIHMTSRTPPSTWERLARSGTRWHVITRGEVDTALPGLGAVVDLDTAASRAPEVAATPSADSGDGMRGRILETSGSSGEPKWVHWTEESLLADREAWCQQVGLSARDTVVNIHPLDFAHGVDVHVLAALCVGARVVHIRADATASDTIQTIRDVAGTYMSALPAHYDSLARTAEASPDIGEHMAVALTGGALLTPSTAELAADRCGLHLRRLYGATESGIMCADLRPRLQAHPELRPMDGVQMHLRGIPGIDPELHRVGEPLFRREFRARGYWGDPERTDRTFADGWYHSGDAVRIADDGSVSVLGRADDVWVNDCGELCSAGALVDEISCIDGVDEVVVFAPKVHPGGRTVVFCRLSPVGADMPSIHAHTESALRSHGLSGRTYLMSDWPRTSVGKPNRRSLLAWAGEH